MSTRHPAARPENANDPSRSLDFNSYLLPFTLGTASYPIHITQDSV